MIWSKLVDPSAVDDRRRRPTAGRAARSSREELAGFQAFRGWAGGGRGRRGPILRVHPMDSSLPDGRQTIGRGRPAFRW